MHFGEMHRTEDFLGVGKCNFISVKTVSLYLVHQLLKKGRKKEKNRKGVGLLLTTESSRNTFVYSSFVITWSFS